MARGWESKAVEDQQAEAVRKAEQSYFKPLSAAELAQHERLESLRLAQSQLREQLARARSEVQRQRWASALRQLEVEITQCQQPAKQEDSRG